MDYATAKASVKVGVVGRRRDLDDNGSAKTLLFFTNVSHKKTFPCEHMYVTTKLYDILAESSSGPTLKRHFIPR